MLDIVGEIEELKHQDYHGKSIKVRITDEEGASLLKNSKEQSVTEKLRALLIFGSNDRRYKDIYGGRGIEI